MVENTQLNLNQPVIAEFLDFVYKGMSEVHKKDGLSEREQAFNFLKSLQSKYILELNEEGIKVIDRKKRLRGIDKDGK